MAELLKLHQRLIDRYRGDAAAAESLVTVGQAPRTQSVDVAELAALTMLANLILNLDESITRN